MEKSLGIKGYLSKESTLAKPNLDMGKAIPGPYSDVVFRHPGQAQKAWHRTVFFNPNFITLYTYTFLIFCNFIFFKFNSMKLDIKI